MPAPATRPRRLALALAAITAVTLGTVSASTAAASDSSGATDDPPRERPGIAVGYAPTEYAPDDVDEANDEFAACMRGEGRTVFPDFRAEKGEDGEIRLQVRMKAYVEGADDSNPLGKAYRKAIKKCAPILEEAGITLPAAPGGIRPPDLPGHPDGDELPELREHIEQDDDGKPSLTTNKDA